MALTLAIFTGLTVAALLLRFNFLAAIFIALIAWIVFLFAVALVLEAIF